MTVTVTQGALAVNEISLLADLPGVKVLWLDTEKYPEVWGSGSSEDGALDVYFSRRRPGKSLPTRVSVSDFSAEGEYWIAEAVGGRYEAFVVLLRMPSSGADPLPVLWRRGEAGE